MFLLKNETKLMLELVLVLFSAIWSSILDNYVITISSTAALIC